MKENKDFLELLSEYSPEAAPLSERETQKIMARTGVLAAESKKRSGMRFKVILIAAAVSMSMAAVTAAAINRSVSNTFKDVLVEEDASGEKIPISSMSPIVDKSGIVIEQTVVDGLEITVRGVVGDSDNFKILIDICDPAGEPIVLKQPDGSFSNGFIRFGKASLSDPNAKTKVPFGVDGWVEDSSGNLCRGEEVISISEDKSRITMLIMGSGENLIGKTLNLELNDIWQQGVQKGTDVGMSADDLYNIVSQFGGHKSGDFYKSGCIYDQTGATTWSYSFVTPEDGSSPDTSKKIPLAPGLENICIIDAAVYQDLLILQGTCPYEVGYGWLISDTDHFSLFNQETGEIIGWDSAGTDYDRGDTGEIVWHLAFRGIKSIEDIKGFVLIHNDGEAVYVLKEGEWKFEIPLTFENTMIKSELNGKFTLGGFEMTAGTLSISPYYINVKASVTDDVYDKMMYISNPVTVDWNPFVTGFTEWDKAELSDAVLTMKDGREITLPVYTCGYDKTLDFNFNLPVVIDPEQAESLKIGDTVFPINN